jgi:CubicO group peptidase (beta-lactamase class C family)
MNSRKAFFRVLVFLCLSHVFTFAQTINVAQKLGDFDPIVNQILKDWNVPGCGVGIVVKDKLVFAKGYGYRNVEKKLPVTPNTLFQIASNSKLFTATAVGFLVDQGKMNWDKPVKNYVPRIQFFNDELTNNVTIRDMLSHRTGISRHDGIWYKSSFSRAELFNRLKYLEPSLPLREGYLYNNLMYMAAGQIIEDVSGQTWEKFVTANIFTPLNMTHSIFVPEDMAKQADFMSPYYEKRDTNTLLPYPLYKEMQGVGPAGSIISSINDMSNWVIAQMNGGKFNGKQVIPQNVITETLQPASLSARMPTKYFENINSMYGMGRSTSSYKGHYRTQHGGAIGGIFSQVTMQLTDSIGVIVFVNGAHGRAINDIVTNMVYDKLLDLPKTDWNERALSSYLKGKETARISRQNPKVDQIKNTKPSHALADYVGTYEDEAYGKLKIEEKNGELIFAFNNISLVLNHYHYDRFDTPNDEIFGAYSILFSIDAQGSISQAKISMDEKEVVFLKKADAKFADDNYLKHLVGKFELNNLTATIELSNQELTLLALPAPPMHLIGYKNNSFRIKEFSDQIIEFTLDAGGQATGFKWIANGQAISLVRKK